jgi:cell division protein FtsI/penicillin-binding protein 2
MSTPRKAASADTVSLFFFAAFAVLALAAGYWTLVARDGLTARTDNPRALIAYNRIHRGTIWDRNNQPLAQTNGDPGDYVRQVESSAALVVGHASFTYGTSGVESIADLRLSGADALDSLTRWWQYDVLGEPQMGRDVTLTIDSQLQQAAFAALDGHLGAFVIIDSDTGDVLAMASAPSYDPALLDASFETLSEDLNGPLVNRAILGLYNADDLLALFPRTLDLSQTPILPTSVRPAEGTQLTPLHMAYLVAATANDGVMPPAKLIAEPKLSTDAHPIAIVPRQTATDLERRLSAGISATLASGFEDETLGWYIRLANGGRYAVAIVLENATAQEAEAVWEAGSP